MVPRVSAITGVDANIIPHVPSKGNCFVPVVDLKV